MAVLLILIGVLCGIAGGMGLGGGTLLIPLVTIIFNIAQKSAQFINVFSFVIMASIVVVFHIKNKLVSVFPAIVFSLVGLVFSIVSSLLLKNISSNTLKVMFGIFILIIAFCQLMALISNKNQKN